LYWSIVENRTYIHKPGVHVQEKRNSFYLLYQSIINHGTTDFLEEFIQSFYFRYRDWWRTYKEYISSFVLSENTEINYPEEEAYEKRSIYLHEVSAARSSGFSYPGGVWLIGLHTKQPIGSTQHYPEEKFLTGIPNMRTSIQSILISLIQKDWCVKGKLSSYLTLNWWTTYYFSSES
jgi:hypothetical protein